MPGQRCHPGNIEIIVFGHRDRTQRTDQLQPPEKLHASRVGDVHLWVTRGGGVALHQHALDAAS
jgi:hypothetical protein